MIQSGLLTLSTFVSAIFFPWPFTAFLALIASFFEPLVPLSVGLFADTLYYDPQAGTLPVFTLYGLALSIIIVLVRTKLRTDLGRDV